MNILRMLSPDQEIYGIRQSWSMRREKAGITRLIRMSCYVFHKQITCLLAYLDHYLREHEY